MTWERPQELVEPERLEAQRDSIRRLGELEPAEPLFSAHLTLVLSSMVREIAELRERVNQAGDQMTDKSECCGATIDASRGDGVWIGSCSACGASVCRINPRTGRNEWLDGASPWTTDDDLRPMDFRTDRGG